MNNVIEIDNLNFKYGDNIIFENLSLQIEKGSWTSIIGPNGTGKTTLVKILTALYKADGFIKINDIVLDKNTFKEVRKSLGVVLSNPDNQFTGETVQDTLVFPLENLNYSKSAMDKRLKEVITNFSLTELLDFKPWQLTTYQKQLVALATSLITEPAILILDEALLYLDNLEKKEYLKILKGLNKNGLTILSITNDLNETLYSNRLIGLNNSKIILDGKPETVFLEEKELKKMGLKLPFIIDLSIKLQYYGLLDKLVFKMDEMVDILWK